MMNPDIDGSLGSELEETATRQSSEVKKGSRVFPSSGALILFSKQFHLHDTANWI
jgi:hypothetical protein